MLIRLRNPGDLDGCVALVGVVHRLDGYPPWLPGDLRAFLNPPDALAAWVAVEDDGVVGHVALHASGPAAVIDRAASVTGLPPDRLATVARLFVGPAWRRRGLGRMLLAGAAAEAAERGQRPVLDVVARSAGAISLYESCGWTSAGLVTFHLGDGSTLRSWVYVGPETVRVPGAP